MANKKFNVDAWADRPGTTTKQTPVYAPSVTSCESGDDVEIVVARIEDAGVDIAPSYDEWVKVGFALAELKGEAGREYFHRISRLHGDYDQAKTDKQYTECLKGRKTGVNGQSFFHYAKNAGVDIRTKASYSKSFPNSPKSPRGENGETGKTNEEEEQVKMPLPTFSQDVIDHLPDFLRRIAAKGNTPQEKDTLIIAAILVLSGCLPHIYGIYDGMKVYPNLYLFLSAPASSGKGRAALCRNLIQPIHNQMREAYKRAKEAYALEMQEWEAEGKAKGHQKPEEPIERMLVIPANSSSTAVYQILNDNGGCGIIFETEADTLTNSFASDYANYSDGFRKAFHHETISYYRRTNREYVDIEEPRLSALLTGTPKQVTSLLQSPEDGLVSRFIFYQLEPNLQWKNVWAGKGEQSLGEYFTKLGEEFLDVYDTLSRNSELEFSFSPSQQEQFNAYFSQLQEECYAKMGEDVIASVRRLGIICFRIGMVFTALRMMEDGDFYSPLACSDVDFNSALSITKVLIVHTLQILGELSKGNVQSPIKGLNDLKKANFLRDLPEVFDRQDYIETAQRLNVPVKTAEKWISKFCEQNGPLEHTERGKFRKKNV